MTKEVLVLENILVYIIKRFGLNTLILFNALLSQVLWICYSNSTTMCKVYYFSGKLHKAQPMHTYIQKLMGENQQGFWFKSEFCMCGLLPR